MLQMKTLDFVQGWKMDDDNVDLLFCIYSSLQVHYQHYQIFPAKHHIIERKTPIISTYFTIIRLVQIRTNSDEELNESQKSSQYEEYK